MKKIKIIISILIIMIFMVPTFSMGANLYCSCHGRNLVGIWHAMKINKLNWVDGDVPDLSDTFGNEWFGYDWKGTDWFEKDNNAGSFLNDGVAMHSLINQLGAMCYGHVGANGDGSFSGKYNVVVVDIDDEVKYYKKGNTNSTTITDANQRKKYYKLAYYAEGSTSKAAGLAEIGSHYDPNANQTTNPQQAVYKEYIRGWTMDNYQELGILPQNTTWANWYMQESKGGRPASIAPIYKGPYFNDANAYANKMVNATSNKITFKTTSTDKEGAKQTIETKTINGKDYTFIGPYNLQHAGGTLDGTAVITTKEDAKINATLCSTDGKTTQNLSSLGNYAGDTFYIVTEATVDSVKKIDLTKKQQIPDVIKARIVFGVPVGGGFAQNMAVYFGQKTTVTKSFTVILPGVPESKIKITKVRKVSGARMSDIGLVAYSKEGNGYVKLNGSRVEYVSDIHDATTYTTDKNGEVTIDKLIRKGEYTIYEVVHPDADQKGFREASYENPLEVGKVEVKSMGTTAEIKIENLKEYIRISGKVWEDRPFGKEPTLNHKYNDDENDRNDKLVQNVTVYLKRKDGAILGTKVTDSNGYYQFTHVPISGLREYYIEFVYNGMSYQCVDVGDLDYSVTNTSKASEGESRETFNNKFKTITYNNANGDEGDISLKYNQNVSEHTSVLDFEGNPKYGYSEAEFPVSGVDEKYQMTSSTYNAYNKYIGEMISITDLYVGDQEEIENINLGLREREQPDLAVMKDLKNVKISVNGKNQIYEYENRFKNADIYGNGFDIGVKFGEKYGNMKYSRPVYKADYTFEAKDGEEGFKVKLIYRIAIRNNSSNLFAKVNEIVDFYDNRYITSETKIGTEIDLSNNEVTNSGNLSFITDEDYNNQDYTRMTINTENFGIIQPQEMKNIYVSFELGQDAVNQIINDGETLENVTEITSYSIYSDIEGTASYAGIDKNSNPGNAIPGDKTTYEDDTDSAPALQLVNVDNEDERTITGKVFEDMPIQELKTENIREGNGVYDENEAGVDEVVVQLMRKTIEDNTPKWEIIQEVETKSGGNYEFTKVPAGEYAIRFVWGDDTYSVYDYKSTIYDETKYQNGKWYLKTSERYSDAKDYYDSSDVDEFWEGMSSDGIAELEKANNTREVIDNELNSQDINHKTNYETDKKIISVTPEMSVDIEKLENNTIINNNENGEDVIEIPSENPNEKPQQVPVEKGAIENIDFGIIERPMQSLKLEKDVSHARLTLTNGQTVVDARIEDGKVINEAKMVTVYPEISATIGTPKQLKSVLLQIDNELVQGSTLEVEYTLKVRNTSEIDYKNKEFYHSGRKSIRSGMESSKITPVKIIDYLDKTWVIDTKDETYLDSNWEEKSQFELQTNEEVAQSVYQPNGITRIKDRQIFTTTKLGNKALAIGEVSQNLKMKVKKVLSTFEMQKESEDERVNEGEIIAIRKTGGGRLRYAITGEDENGNPIEEVKEIIPGNYVPGSSSEIITEPDDDGVEVKLTPNTGDNKNYVIPVIVGISALTILGAGAVLIKKKVL